MQKAKELIYLPVLKWAHQLIKPDNTIIVGINGPQGSGKSTLCDALVELAPSQGFKAATLSIDDFYLTRPEQVALSNKYKDNPYLQQRGYPGTHDVTLGTSILSKIKSLKTTGRVSCPQYDKSAYQGQGDRHPENRWKTMEAPIDILFFEGWMLGFTPVSEKSINDHKLKQINALLEAYKYWDNLLDAFVQLTPSKISNVIAWRVEAEEKRITKGEAGMSKEEVEDYVKKFIPAYETYLPELKKSTRYAHSCNFTIFENRLPKIHFD